MIEECGFIDIPGGATGKTLLVANGPSILVDVGFDSNWNPSSNQNPIPGIRGIKALIDTGATACCIDNMVAVQLNLPMVDRQPIGGVGGKHTANVYLAQIRVPALMHIMHGLFFGVDLKAGGQQHEVLMGRSFLAALSLSYDGKTGRVTLSK